MNHCQFRQLLCLLPRSLMCMCLLQGLQSVLFLYHFHTDFRLHVLKANCCFRCEQYHLLRMIVQCFRSVSRHQLFPNHINMSRLLVLQALSEESRIIPSPFPLIVQSLSLIFSFFSLLKFLFFIYNHPDYSSEELSFFIQSSIFRDRRFQLWNPRLCTPSPLSGS